MVDVSQPLGTAVPYTPPKNNGGADSARGASGVAFADDVVVNIPPGADRGKQIKCIQDALCNKFKDNARVMDAVRTGAFADLISSYLEHGVEPGRVPSRLAWLISNLAQRTDNSLEVSATIISKFYVKTVIKLLAAGYKEPAILDTLAKLEEQARILNVDCGFEHLGLTMPIIRKWLSDIVNAQLNPTTKYTLNNDLAMTGHGPRMKKTVKPPVIKLDGTTDELPDILSQIKIGTDEFGALLKVNHVGKITKAAMDYLFGDQNGVFEAATDVPTLEKFTAEIRDNVLVFSQMMSSDALGHMIKLFSADRFVLIGNAKMAAGVKSTLLREIRKNIWADPTLTTLSQKQAALMRAKAYLEAGDIEKLTKAEFGVKDANNNAVSFLGDHSASHLVEFMQKAKLFIQKGNPAAVMTPYDVEFMYSMGGFASLISTVKDRDSALKHLLAAGGKDGDLTSKKGGGLFGFLSPGIKYGVDEVDELMTRFAAEYGLYGDSGQFTYRPEIVDFRERVSALRDTGKAVKAIQSLREEEKAADLEGASAVPELPAGSSANTPATQMPQTAVPQQTRPATPPASTPAAPSIVAPPAGNPPANPLAAEQGSKPGS